MALEFFRGATPVQQELIPKTWPYNEALVQYEKTADKLASLRLKPQPSVDFVVAHCRESLVWLNSEMGFVPPESSLYVYEKCGLETDLRPYLGHNRFKSVYTVPRPDFGGTRGDECSAYLTHITTRFDELADYTVFLQSDPHEHLHFDFVDVALRSIAARTYDVPFLHLNGARHVRTLTPCLQAVHQAVFGLELSGP